mmetsp:Transcript_36566/g.67650  ORF Transcript_36566/g.67650 Transcript_36566/m.67650 type:complete len:112 (-) Transcript_36566:1142-1477(-)
MAIAGEEIAFIWPLPAVSSCQFRTFRGAVIRPTTSRLDTSINDSHSHHFTPWTAKTTTKTDKGGQNHVPSGVALSCCSRKKHGASSGPHEESSPDGEEILSYELTEEAEMM